MSRIYDPDQPHDSPIPVATGGPSVDTYYCDWVHTSRAADIGTYLNTSLYMKLVNTGTEASGILGGASGFTRIEQKSSEGTGLCAFEIIPVITWAELPGGIYEIIFGPGASPAPLVSGDPVIIKTIFDENWKTAIQGVAGQHPTLAPHAVEFRFACHLWEGPYPDNTRDYRRGELHDVVHCLWLSPSPGTGSTYSETYNIGKNPPMTAFWTHAYNPTYPSDLDVSCTLKCFGNGHEQFSAEQDTNENGLIQENWDWPEGCPKRGGGIGTTRAEFRVIPNAGTSVYIDNGMMVNGVSHRRASNIIYIFDRQQQFHVKTGMRTIYSSASAVAPGHICHFPYDLLHWVGYGEDTFWDKFLPAINYGTNSANAGHTLGQYILNDYVSEDDEEIIFATTTAGLTDYDLRLRHADNDGGAAITYTSTYSWSADGYDHSCTGTASSNTFTFSSTTGMNAQVWATRRY